MDYRKFLRQIVRAIYRLPFGKVYTIYANEAARVVQGLCKSCRAPFILFYFILFYFGAKWYNSCTILLQEFYFILFYCKSALPTSQCHVCGWLCCSRILLIKLVSYAVRRRDIACSVERVERSPKFGIIRLYNSRSSMCSHRTVHRNRERSAQ